MCEIGIESTSSKNEKLTSKMCLNLTISEFKNYANKSVITDLYLMSDSYTYGINANELFLDLPNLVYLKTDLYNVKSISSLMEKCPNLQCLDLRIETYDERDQDMEQKTNNDNTNNDSSDDEDADFSKWMFNNICEDFSKFTKLETVKMYVTNQIGKFELISPTIKMLVIVSTQYADHPIIYNLNCPTLESLYRKYVDFNDGNVIFRNPSLSKTQCMERKMTDTNVCNIKMHATNTSQYNLPLLKFVYYYYNFW
ncbi:hypothetical protein [Neodiprion abietis nucleopolyhedrovirus]|uniref:Uncharacterized protein n=1 Tax=Neodiprion abietis nucleopolyhedrovirus TaxID=204507 RepID=Q0ZP65_9CBAC|nr:hypothetical protein [Neodiprion abietis nucleopolyhedrovirus]ABC74889.1 unknown [Neodiprion abietis nucleopolyhedrovirus]